jgi:hypothetical protein
LVPGIPNDSGFDNRFCCNGVGFNSGWGWGCIGCIGGIGFTLAVGFLAGFLAAPSFLKNCCAMAQRSLLSPVDNVIKI